MRTPAEHIKTLQRRVDFLKSREHINSFDKAEVGSLEWALVNLQPQRTWVNATTWRGLTDEEIEEIFNKSAGYCRDDFRSFARSIEAKLKEKNT